MRIKVCAFAFLVCGFDVFADVVHVKDYRTNEVTSAVGGGHYKAFFESEIELPDFHIMPASLVAQFIELTTGQKTNDIHAAVWQERSDFFKECKQSEDADGERFVHGTTAKLVYQDNRFMSYRINYQHYAGAPCGAANEGETKNVAFDCRRGKVLTAADIVSKENNRKLLNLIRQKLYQQFKDKGDEFEAFAEPETRTDEKIAEVVSWAGKGDIGTPWVSDNFCITSDGMEWTFMPCEIVSASHGTITVKVPWRELKGVVSKEFIIR